MSDVTFPIPKDVLSHIFSFVPQEQQGNLPLVCKSWNVAYDNLLKTYWNALKKMNEAPKFLKERMSAMNPQNDRYVIFFQKLLRETSDELLWQGGRSEVNEMNQKYQKSLDLQRFVELEAQTTALEEKNWELIQDGISQSEGHETNIFCYKGKLRGIPKKITNLDAKHLSFHDNDISCIPPYISELKHLESLFFYQNRIERLPKELSELPNLSRLNLFRNPLKEFPEHMGKLFNKISFTLILDKENFLKYGKEIERAIQQNASIWTKILGIFVAWSVLLFNFYMFLILMICFCRRDKYRLNEASFNEIAASSEKITSVHINAFTYYASFGKFEVYEY